MKSMVGVCITHSRETTMNIVYDKIMKIYIPKVEYQKCGTENTFLPNLSYNNT